MSDGTASPFDDAGGREYGRALVVLSCVLAVAVAAVLVPLVSSGGPGGTPAGAAVPIPGFAQDGTAGGTGGTGGDGSEAARASRAGESTTTAGSLGALDPGERTGVGGSLAAANETDPFRRLGAETHFVVRTTEPTYWRTGAYDRYTGTGWTDTLSAEPYDPPIDPPGLPGREVRYEVRLARSAGALPTAWRPRSVEPRTGVVDLALTGASAVRPAERVPAGTTYVATSTVPERSVSVLRSSGRDYPAGIEERYTQLPRGPRERLAPFVANLTDGTSSPYGTATAVEGWLESTKEYSLNVSEPPGEDVATGFVFGMEAGYCEYFATAMTAMLRSQGVPARYVVGYSPGQPSGPNEYTVRGMNAHAWVEVYFADVGWVRFDPTPGSERLAAESAALESRTGTTLATAEEGSPGETSLSPAAANATDGGDGTGASSTTTAGTPTTGPSTGGAAGTGTGTMAGTATGAMAGTATGTATDGGGDSGDGEPTDASGSGGTPTPAPVGTPAPAPTPTPGGGGSGTPTPTATPTPDERASETPTGTPTPTSTPTPTPRPPVEVSLNRSAVPGATVNVTVTRGGSPVVGAGVLFDGDRVGTTDATGSVLAEVPYARRLNVTVLPPPASASVGRTTRRYAVAPFRDGEGNTTVSFEVPTEVSVTVSGDRTTNGTVVVTAAVEDVPFRDAAVLLDGERVARTDRSGRAEIRLPAEPGNVTLAVERGALSGTRTLSLARLSVSAEPTLPLALPFTRVEVTARLGNATVAGAPVTVEGRRVGTTGVDGSLSPRLPFAPAADLVVSKHGQRRRTVLDGLYRNLAGVTVALALLVAGAAFAVRRSERDPRAAASRGLAALARAARLAVDAVVRAGELAHAGLSGLLTVPGRVAARLADLAAGRVTVAELARALLAWLLGVLDAARGLLRDARAASIRARTTGDRASGASGGDGESAEERQARLTLREVWEAFVGHVSVARRRTRTPGEVAAHAVRVDGLPAEPVETIRDAYREVEYGRRSPGERLPRAETALRAVEDALAVDADDSARPEGTDDGVEAGDDTDATAGDTTDDDGGAGRAAERAVEPDGGPEP